MTLSGKTRFMLDSIRLFLSERVTLEHKAGVCREGHIYDTMIGYRIVVLQS